MDANRKRLALLATVLVLPLSWIAASRAGNEARFPMPEAAQYREECGACHTAYAPGLLPARSWRKTMAELSEHFGEDAELEPAPRDAILNWLISAAADSAQANPLMRRIAAAIPAGEIPSRISTGPFFRYMHDEVPGAIWQRKSIGSRSNCLACHPRANDGGYAEAEVRIPK